MKTLFFKEISSFFGSLTGYVFIIFIYIVSGLLIWVFPGQFNVLDGGYSTLDPVFLMAPGIFSLLVPAVTMKMFTEEKKSGTLDLLLTKPLTEFHIVISKLASALVLVVISFISFLVYFISIYLLGAEPGNIDIGATWGSLIGLLLLAASFVSIGLFASVLTENSIVAYLIGIVICYFFYLGFDAIASLYSLNKFSSFILYLGINEHYQSISRGVIDSRDIVYFIALLSFFILLTTTLLKSRKW